MPEAMTESRYSSRKFLLVLIAVFGGAALQLVGKLDPLLVELVKWTLGLYFAANVGQKATAKEQP